MTDTTHAMEGLQKTRASPTRITISALPPRARRQKWMPPAAVWSPVALLCLWEFCARAGWIEVQFFPAPSTIVHTFIESVQKPQFWSDLTISLIRMAVGFLIGTSSGLLLGLAMGLFEPVRKAIKPLISALYPIPKIALLPLILLIFGLGEASKYAIVALGSFYLMTFNTLAGVQNIPRIYFDVARNLKASRTYTYLTVALPGALPGIFTGLRICVGNALLLLVAAEFVGAERGVGYRIWWAWSVFWVDSMYVGLATIALLGFLLSAAVDLLEKWLIPWSGK